MTPKIDEAKVIRIRRATKGTPAELVISRDGKDCAVWVLREAQLRGLVKDAVDALP